MRKVDVIVPCFNEAERVGRVLKVLSSSPYIKKVILVDDGSTDNSAEVAKEFPKTQVIKLAENVGKGGAVKAGLEKVDTDTVFISDADIRGFKEEHVEALIKEHQKNPSSLTIGLREKHNNKLLFWIRKKFIFNIDGERILPSKDLKKIVSSRNSEKFGLEAWMNYYFRKKKIKPGVVRLGGLIDGSSMRKGTKNLALEFTDIGETYLEIYKETLRKTLI